AALPIFQPALDTARPSFDGMGDSRCGIARHNLRCSCRTARHFQRLEHQHLPTLLRKTRRSGEAVMARADHDRIEGVARARHRLSPPLHAGEKFSRRVGSRRAHDEGAGMRAWRAELYALVRLRRSALDWDVNV